MELKIHFKTLPQNMKLEQVEAELDVILEDDGWRLGAEHGPQGGFIELELEDEKANPKYGIMAVKNYLQKREFAPDTAIELAGTVVGIYA